MPAYVLMKAFENAPARYDGAMQLLTLGRIDKLKRAIADAVSGNGRRVLELGCGAGSLATMMAEGGAQVLGIDSSESMLETARERVTDANVAPQVELRRLSVMEIDTLPAGSFDFVVSTLVLSELSDSEIEFVMREAKRLLAPGGQLLIGDEVAASGPFRRFGFGLLRLPLQLITYLITQAQSLPAAGWARTLLYFSIELPLMLVVFFLVPPSSRPLKNIERSMQHAGFRVAGGREYLGGTLKLVHAAVA